MGSIMKSNEVCDGFDLHVSVPKEMLCDLDTHSRNKLSWCHVEVGPEEAGKMTGRHADRRRDGYKSQGPGKVIAEIVQSATDHWMEAADGTVLVIDSHCQMFHQIIESI